jgi:hypothetical protein
MFDTSGTLRRLLPALLLCAGVTAAEAPRPNQTSLVAVPHAKAGNTVPQGFSSYAAATVDATRHCVVGATSDEDGAHQVPFVYVEDTTANRVLWSRALALPAGTYQARATHCVRERDTVHVLQQSDAKAGQDAIQTRLQVVDLALAGGDVQGIRDVTVPNVAEAYSAWVDKGDEGMHMSGKSLVVAGEYDRMAAPGQPAAFKATIH